LNGINWTEPELGNYQFCQTWTAADLDIVLSFLYDLPKDLLFWLIMENLECNS